MTELQGLAALVTGGASGIGAAIVELLVERGALVAVLDLAPSTEASPAQLTVDCDVTDTASVDEAVARVVEKFGRLDIVINNAGVGAVGDVAASTDDQWRAIFNVNVFGVARVSRAALPHLRRSSHPVIVNTCSVVAEIGVRDRAVYSASKGAVAALTRAMAADYVGDGIRVNAVAPGTADTPWVTRLLDASENPAQAQAALKARQPTGRLVTAAEVAYAVAGLASPLASATTGVILPIDGGMASLRV